MNWDLLSRSIYTPRVGQSPISIFRSFHTLVLLFTPNHVTSHLTGYDIIIFFTPSHVTLCKQRCEWEYYLNTYTSQKGTTQDQPTNQFDISIKLSAPFYLDQSVRRRENALFFPQYISSIIIYTSVYTIIHYHTL